jgi:hypothetical protein
MNRISLLFRCIIIGALLWSCDKEVYESADNISHAEQAQIAIPQKLDLKHNATNDTVHFISDDYWEVLVTDNKSTSWLTVEPTSGGPGNVTLIVKAQENSSEEEREAVITINYGDKSESFTIYQAPTPVVYYFDAPWNGYERGIITNNGNYFLVYKDTASSDYVFFIGDKTGNQFATHVDSTGLIRQFIISDTVYSFDFNENSVDIYINAGDRIQTIEDISYDTFNKNLNNTPSFIRTRATGNETVQPYYDAANLIAGVAGGVEACIKDGAVAKAGASSMLSIAGYLTPDEHPVAKDLLNAGAGALAIAALIPAGGTALAWTGGALGLISIGEIAWRRSNFGGADIKMERVGDDEESCKTGIAIATIKDSNSIPFMKNKSLFVKFIVKGPDNFRRTYDGDVKNDTSTCKLTSLRPGVEYKCRARLYKKWYEDPKTRQKFGCPPDLLGTSAYKEGYQYHETLYSLDGGEVSFTLSFPNAITGDVINTDKTWAFVGCSFIRAKNCDCGVALLNNDGEVIYRFTCLSFNQGATLSNLQPATTYGYYSFVECEGEHKGEIKYFTTDAPSFAGTWNCVETWTDSQNHKQSETYTIVLQEDGNAIINKPNYSKPQEATWSQTNLKLHIQATDYAYSDQVGGRSWYGTATIDNFNHIEGFYQTWRWNQYGDHEGDPHDIVLTR